jgi:predicted HicB family RNase H-like nuclease
MDEQTAKVVIYLRAPAELRNRLDAHAKRLGISINAAALTLLDEALRAAEKETR